MREKDKTKHEAMAMLMGEGEWLEPVMKANPGLSLMVKPKDTGPSSLIEEDAIEELFTLNIQVKNKIIGTIIDIGSQKNLILARLV